MAKQVKDPYLYPRSKVLKNKLGVRDIKRLESIEADFTALRLRELALSPISGGFDFAHVCAIHKYKNKANN